MTNTTPDPMDDRPAGLPPDRRPVIGAGTMAAGGLALSACSPTVRVEAPERPIEINLNVNITQEVRIRIDRDLESLFEENDDIF